MNKKIILLAIFTLVLCGCVGGSKSKTLTVKTSLIYDMAVTFDKNISKDIENAHDAEEDEYYFYYKDSCLYFENINVGLANLVTETFSITNAEALQNDKAITLGTLEGFDYYEEDIYADADTNDYYFRTPILGEINGVEVKIWATFFGKKEDVREFASHTSFKLVGLINS